MSTTDDLKNFDLRTLERKLRRGLVTRKEYDKYLKGLPDRADNVAPADSRKDDDDDEE